MNDGRWLDGDVIGHRVESSPEKTALIDAETGEKWSYREMNAEVEKIAESLSFSESGENFGILIRNGSEFVFLVHAAMRYDVTLVPLNLRDTPSEIRDNIEKADVSKLVFEKELREKVEKISRAENLSCDVSIGSETNQGSGNEIGVVDLDERENTTESNVTVEGDRFILFTSGTTGEPKPVVLSDRNILASATSSAFRLGLDTDDRWLVPLPMYHMGGLAPVVRSALYGTTVVIENGFKAEKTVGDIKRYGISCISVVPTMLESLLSADSEAVSSLRFVLVGGAPASEELVRRCEKNEVPVCPTYGMTETASQVATALPEEVFEREGTVGTPLMYTKVKIVEDGEVVERGEKGEIVVSGPSLGRYYGDEDDDVFGEHGFGTDDIGYRDEDGFLWVVGRKDDLIISGGENIHPKEVQGTLLENSGVEEVAVVGIEDEKWGEAVSAVVVGDVSREEILKFARERLAGYKVPKKIVFADGIPRTDSGTVDREKTRELIRRKT